MTSPATPGAAQMPDAVGRMRNPAQGETAGAQQGPGASNPAMPADVLIFRFPRSLAWLVLASALLFFALAGLACAALLADRAHSIAIALPTLLVLGPLGVLSLRSFGRFRDRVAINSEGIWYLPRSGEPTFIAWADVVSVSAHDNRQRLVLCDSTGKKTVRLEYQLQNFSELRDLVLRQTAPATHLRAPGAVVFHRTWINKAILLGVTALFLRVSWLSLHEGQRWVAWYLLGFAALLLLAFVLDPTRVLIKKDAIVVTYTGWKRTIPFEAITGIALADVRDHGNVWAAVVIRRRRRRALKLFRFREGSVALHDALTSAWRSTGERA